ncbi:hypothetical protein [Nocardia sp. NPDC050710]|uniref:hypothetical protein n=1 Tax=Nocardia sp. NPDC050710 TaxID=3157220 RepID=UPI0033CB47F9
MPIRPLTFRERLDVPFALIQANITTLAGLSLAGLFIAETIVVVLTASLSGLTDGSDTATWWGAIGSTAVCAWLLRYALRGTTVAIGLATVSGHRVGWRAALGRLRDRALPLLVFQLLFTLVGLGVIVVSCVLIITAPAALPWLGWLRAKRFVAVPAIFAERIGHAPAVHRAKLLAAGSEWSMAGLWMAQRALFALLAVPLLGIPLFLVDFTGTHRWPVIVLVTSAVLLLIAFGEVVEASSRVVSYVDLRCRREGLDIRIPEAR